MLPPRSSVVMTGTWFVQAAGKGKHRTHNSEVLANNKGVSAQAWSLLFPKGLFAIGKNTPAAEGNLMLKPEYSLWNRPCTPWGWQREGNGFSQILTLKPSAEVKLIKCKESLQDT